MTLEEIRRSDREILFPSDIAPVLRCDPHAIRLCARSHPEQLGFPVSVIRHRTLIPRAGFLSWLEGRSTKSKEE